MRIVVDTNVIASAIYFGGKPYELLKLIMEERISAIASKDIVEEYEVGLNESTEYAAVDDNDTYSFYYASNTAQLTGNAIVINPQINPKVQNGTAEHQNARLYVDRENTDNWSSEAKDAYIDNESRVYEIFKKYGWTWGG